ncbi:MAG: hypothetical protein ABI268_12275, partial [Rhodanobacter sp.]
RSDGTARGIFVPAKSIPALTASTRRTPRQAAREPDIVRGSSGIGGNAPCNMSELMHWLAQERSPY